VTEGEATISGFWQQSDYTKCAEGLCKWLEGDENRALPSYVGPFSPQYTTPTPVLIQSEDINTLWGSGHDPMRHSAQQHETRRPRRSVSQNALQRPLTGHLPFPALHNELKRNKMGSRFGQPELQQGKDKLWAYQRNGAKFDRSRERQNFSSFLRNLHMKSNVELCYSE